MTGVQTCALPICFPVTIDGRGNYAYGHYTHEKNPVTTRSALTTLQILESEGLVDNAKTIGELALNRLRDMMTRYPLIGDVRGRGCLIGVELVSDRLRRSPAYDAAEILMYKALERGLSFKVSMGNILILSPPLTTTVEEMTQALDILEKCIEEKSVVATIVPGRD